MSILCASKQKKNANKPKYLLRTTKGLWQPTTDHSEDSRYLKGHICTNAISNYSLAKKNTTYLLMYLILIENCNKKTCSIITKNWSSNLVFRT